MFGVATSVGIYHAPYTTLRQNLSRSRFHILLLAIPGGFFSFQGLLVENYPYKFMRSSHPLEDSAPKCTPYHDPPQLELDCVMTHKFFVVNLKNDPWKKKIGP